MHQKTWIHLILFAWGSFVFHTWTIGPQSWQTVDFASNVGAVWNSKDPFPRNVLSFGSCSAQLRSKPGVSRRWHELTWLLFREHEHVIMKSLMCLGPSPAFSCHVLQRIIQIQDAMVGWNFLNERSGNFQATRDTPWACTDVEELHVQVDSLGKWSCTFGGLAGQGHGVMGFRGSKVQVLGGELGRWYLLAPDCFDLFCVIWLLHEAWWWIIANWQ